MSKHKDNTLKRIAIGSGMAAVAGYLVGLLTAPKSGKETRGDIKAAAENSRAQAEKDLKRLHTELGKVIDEVKSKGKKANTKGKEEVKELVDKAADTKEKIREVISAIHEGDADDHDLKKAVENASSAIEHLKDYLKK